MQRHTQAEQVRHLSPDLADFSVQYLRIKRCESSIELYKWLEHGAQVVPGIGLLICEEWLLFSDLGGGEQLECPLKLKQTKKWLAAHLLKRNH